MSTTNPRTDHSPAPSASRERRRNSFVTTRWSVVLTAARPDTTRARAALEKLCQTYWYPLYAYVRRRGYSAEDAEDLTQEFFSRLLATRFLANADQERGRFRSFILTALKHFLADEWARRNTQKRGGGQSVTSLDVEGAETRYRLEPADNLTPETIYEKNWALTLLETAVERLRQEYEADARGPLFAELKNCLVKARSAVPYAGLAGQLNMSEGALRVAVHRLRQRYRDVLRAEIAETVASSAEVEEELRYLFRVLAT